jgi:hypothetical protein
MVNCEAMAVLKCRGYALGKLKLSMVKSEKSRKLVH